MSRQAERERQARVILGESEKQIVDTMNLGGLAGLTSLAKNAEKAA